MSGTDHNSAIRELLEEMERRLREEFDEKMSRLKSELLLEIYQIADPHAHD